LFNSTEQQSLGQQTKDHQIARELDSANQASPDNKPVTKPEDLASFLFDFGERDKSGKKATRKDNDKATSPSSMPAAPPTVRTND